MENVIVKEEDLKIGDEIIVGRFAALLYIRVTHPRRERKDRTGKIRYSRVKGTVNATVIDRSWRDWRGKIHTKKDITYHCTPEGHNMNRYFDLRYRDIWLVKRKYE